MRPLGKGILIALAFFCCSSPVADFDRSLVERLPVNYANEVILSEEDTFPRFPVGGMDCKYIGYPSCGSNHREYEGGCKFLKVLYVCITPPAKSILKPRTYMELIGGTRLNVPGFGDVDRTGLYLFPPHVKQSQYSILGSLFYWFTAMQPSNVSNSLGG